MALWGQNGPSKITVYARTAARSTEQQVRADEKFGTATELCRKKQNARNIYVRLEYKKRKKSKIHAAGKKDAGGDEKLLLFFTWP
jgi:hypothetical protein